MSEVVYPAYRIEQGGLFRCCIETIREWANGERRMDLRCRHCSSTIGYQFDGAYADGPTFFWVESVKISPKLVNIDELTDEDLLKMAEAAYVKQADMVANQYVGIGALSWRVVDEAGRQIWVESIRAALKVVS